MPLTYANQQRLIVPGCISQLQESLPCALTHVRWSRVQNEEAHIERAIQSVRVPGVDMQPEIIVVDAGSTDKTYAVASRHSGVKVLQVPGGRGSQLNEGLLPA